MRFLWLAMLFLSLGCGRAPDIEPLRIAAASDLRFALDDLVQNHGGAERPIQVTYGSSGKFVAQIREGLAIDLFLSADHAYPRELIAAGLAEPAAVFAYARGYLVLWVPRESPLPIETEGIRVLADPRVRRVAIANPRHAPYGQRAEEALRRAGLLETLHDRLVLGENIAQTAQFVESGAADIGLIARSLAEAPRLRDRGRFMPLPAELAPPLEQAGVILKAARDPAAAQAFRAALLGPGGQSLLERHGFGRPGG